MHILQPRSEVPHLLADLEFHMSLSLRSTRRNLRSKCEVNTPAMISQHHFTLPSFKKGTHLRWIFWFVHHLLNGGSTHSFWNSRRDAPWNLLPPSPFSYMSRKLQFKECSYTQNPQAAVIGWAFHIHYHRQKRILSLKRQKRSSWEVASSDAELLVEGPLDMGPWCPAKTKDN